MGIVGGMTYQILRPKEHIYAPVVLGGSVLAMDSFTGADNTLLENHTPEKGGAWAVQAGSARILSNKLKETAGGSKYTQNLGRANLTLEIDYLVGTAEYSGFLFRWVDANNHWFCWAHENGSFYIYERTAGSNTLRANQAIGYHHGDSLRLKLVLMGDSMTFSCTGDHSGTLSYSNSVRNTATIHGLELNAFAPQDGRLDNYLATR